MPMACTRADRLLYGGRFPRNSQGALIVAKVLYAHHLHYDVHHRRLTRRNLLRHASFWFNLHLGIGRWRLTLRSARRLRGVRSATRRVQHGLTRCSAFWVCTAWTTFVASNSQGAANFILSEMAVFEIDFPAGDPLNDGNVRFRAVVWIVSEACLLIAVLVNYLPRTFADLPLSVCMRLRHPQLRPIASSSVPRSPSSCSTLSSTTSGFPLASLLEDKASRRPNGFSPKASTAPALLQPGIGSSPSYRREPS